VEAFYPMAYGTFEAVAEDLPRLIEEIYNSHRINTPGRRSNPSHDHRLKILFRFNVLRSAHWSGTKVT
jgi:hypothetical protein